MTALSMLRAIVCEGRPVTFHHYKDPHDLCNWRISFRQGDGREIRERCDGCNHLPASTPPEELARAYLKNRAHFLRAEAVSVREKHKEAQAEADALGAAALSLEEQAAFLEGYFG